MIDLSSLDLATSVAIALSINLILYVAGVFARLFARRTRQLTLDDFVEKPRRTIALRIVNEGLAIYDVVMLLFILALSRIF